MELTEESFPIYVWRAYKVGKKVRFHRQTASTQSSLHHLIRLGYTVTSPDQVRDPEQEAQRSDAAFESYLADPKAA